MLQVLKNIKPPKHNHRGGFVARLPPQMREGELGTKALHRPEVKPKSSTETLSEAQDQHGPSPQFTFVSPGPTSNPGLTVLDPSPARAHKKLVFLQPKPGPSPSTIVLTLLGSCPCKFPLFNCYIFPHC